MQSQLKQLSSLRLLIGRRQVPGVGDVLRINRWPGFGNLSHHPVYPS